MAAESATAIQRSQGDLSDCVDWSGVECLNQSTSHSLVNALKQGYREDDGLFLESDADEQILIYIPFNQVVKLHSIVIKGPEEEGPKTIKLYSNREHMGFSNVNDFPPSDLAILSEENLKGKPIILKYVKFQNVRSLTLFIEDNQSAGDITKVQKIALFGTTYAEQSRKKKHLEAPHLRLMVYPGLVIHGSDHVRFLGRLARSVGLEFPHGVELPGDLFLQLVIQGIRDTPPQKLA